MKGLNRTLRDVEGIGGKPNTKIARLQQAYAALWNGIPSKDDCEIVLVDLFDFMGYLSTTPPSASSNELWHAEGQRSVAARIMALANPASEEIAALAAAVKAEQRAPEGEYDG